MLFRLSLIACGVFAATAGPAFANATVEFIPADADNDSEVRVVGDINADTIKLSQGATSVTFTPSNGTALTVTGCTGTNPAVCTKPASVSVDLAGGGDSFTTDNTVSVPLELAGGDGNDTLTGGAGNDVLSGGTGNDTLTGGGGIDEYFGGDGDDKIVASGDGLAERISCGNGTDTVDNDPIDIIAVRDRRGQRPRRLQHPD